MIISNPYLEQRNEEVPEIGSNAAEGLTEEHALGQDSLQVGPHTSLKVPLHNLHELVYLGMERLHRDFRRF